MLYHRGFEIRSNRLFIFNCYGLIFKRMGLQNQNPFNSLLRIEKLLHDLWNSLRNYADVYLCIYQTSQYRIWYKGCNFLALWSSWSSLFNALISFCRVSEVFHKKLVSNVTFASKRRITSKKKLVLETCFMVIEVNLFIYSVLLNINYL